MSELEAVMLAEVEGLLARWRARVRGRPDEEAEQLWLLALEREQIVAVAYREEAVAGAGRRPRRSSETCGPPSARPSCGSGRTRSSTPSTCAASCCGAAAWASSMVVYGRQLQGALSGWVTATEHHRDPRTAPLRTGAAGVLVAVAGVTGRIPPVLQRELRFQTFQRYCELNVVLEMTAELAYRRLVELATIDEEREIVRAHPRRRGASRGRIPGARRRAHRRRPARRGGPTPTCVDELAAISEWFLPAPLRDGRGDRDAAAGVRDRRAGRRAQRAHRHRQGRACWTSASTAPGWPSSRPARGCRDPGRRSCSATTARDRSNVNDPELVDGAGRGTCAGTASTTSPCSRRRRCTATCFAHRSVAEVAELLRLRLRRLPHRRHRRATCRPFAFERGLRAAGDQRHVGRRRPADRDAEAAHRPHRVRAPEPVDARGQHRRRSTRPSTPAAGSTSAPPP